MSAPRTKVDIDRVIHGTGSRCIGTSCRIDYHTAACMWGVGGITMRRAEHELLLCCRYTAGDAVTGPRIHELARGEIDWPYVFRAAGRHGVAPLLYRALTAVHGHGAPPEVYDAFRRHVTASGMHSRLLMRRSADTLELFATEGLRTLAFKGGTLATLAYGNVALRQFTDLDLFVHHDDDDRARQLLLRHGYRLHADYGWETHFEAEGRVTVDLHHGLTEAKFPVSNDFDRWWQRRQLVVVDGQAIPTFSSEDLLIVLAVQAAKDAWSRLLRLGKVCDIAQMLVEVPDLDWSAVERQSTRLRVRGMLAFAVALAATLFRVRIPDPLADIARPTRSIRSLVERQAATIFEESDPRAVTTRQRIAFHGHVRERLRDKLWPFVAIPLAIATPSELDRALVSLPASASALYYVLRPLRLLVKYGRRYLGPRLPAR